MWLRQREVAAVSSDAEPTDRRVNKAGSETDPHARRSEQRARGRGSKERREALPQNCISGGCRPARHQRFGQAQPGADDVHGARALRRGRVVVCEKEWRIGPVSASAVVLVV